MGFDHLQEYWEWGKTSKINQIKTEEKRGREKTPESEIWYKIPTNNCPFLETI